MARSLEEQVSKGNMFKLSAKEAKDKYGDRLAVAFLGAIRKGATADGQVDVRVIHDGSMGG